MKANILWLAGMLPLAMACTDSDYTLDKIVPQEYHKILSMYPTGKQTLTIYDTGDATYDYSFKVKKGGSDLQTTATVQLTTLTDQEISDEYSTPENVDYKALPTDCYTLVTKDFNFASGIVYENGTVSFNIDKLKAAMQTDADAVWVIPLKLVSQTDSVNADNNQLFLQLNKVVVPTLGFTSTEVKEVEYLFGQQSGPVTVNIPFGLDMENRWEVDCTFSTQPSYVDAYNSAHGTSYQVLPDGSYTIASTVTLSAGTQATQLPVQVDLSKLAVGNRYMLPVQLTEASKFVVNESAALYPLVISYSYNELDRSNWTASASSEEPAENQWGSVGGEAKHAIDGSTNTLWHSHWDGWTAQLPQWITIDTKSEHMIAQVGMMQRQDKNRDTKSGEFWVSNDGENWTKAGSFTNMPSSTGLFKYDLDTPVRARYFKINITESWRSPYVSLSEIYLYGE